MQRKILQEHQNGVFFTLADISSSLCLYCPYGSPQELSSPIIILSFNFNPFGHITKGIWARVQEMYGCFGIDCVYVIWIRFNDKESEWHTQARNEILQASWHGAFFYDVKVIIRCSEFKVYVAGSHADDYIE